MTQTITSHDLGHGRTLEINGTDTQPIMGVRIRHEGCAGVRLLINNPETRALFLDQTDKPAMWEIVGGGLRRGGPLTLAPEIVCECGQIGWLRRGQWMPNG